MFSNLKKESYAKIFNFTQFQLEESVHRLRGYLNSMLTNESLSFDQVLNGYFIFEKIMKERDRVPKPVVNVGSIKVEEVKKYGIEILNLKKDGYGAQRIIKAMKINHNRLLLKPIQRI